MEIHLSRRVTSSNRDNLVTAFISSFFKAKIKGHVITVPNKHFENIYELPDELGARIYEVSKKMAITLKEVYRCEGVTILQNNEPASDQHAFHYHLHVLPRYKDDDFRNDVTKITTTPEERKPYADKIKAFLSK